ncbi:hypothetical protein BT96DRAFT_357770 [Gymnopus androsaceus JB14]|uniref:Uncharacterized protein n=1 Tax=Gymnopus androsaceus JB14 TaxID=1447944 RepID=A0A6A4I5C2_9AGAR|nr:hypothetical protein BT96DRAFT_357770 [Gymnopus androsaceus JB14]
MRHTDDYLLITADLAKAKQFLKIMNKGRSRKSVRRNLPNFSALGHPEYGCFVSRDKTVANFDFDEQVLNVIPPKQDCMASTHLYSLSQPDSSHSLSMVWICY